MRRNIWKRSVGAGRKKKKCLMREGAVSNGSAVTTASSGRSRAGRSGSSRSAIHPSQLKTAPRSLELDFLRQSGYKYINLTISRGSGNIFGERSGTKPRLHGRNVCGPPGAHLLDPHLVLKMKFFCHIVADKFCPWKITEMILARKNSDNKASMILRF